MSASPLSRRHLLAAALLAAAARATARPDLAVPESARRALSLGQLRAVARRNWDDATWHFVMGAADDGRTARANEAAFSRWQIRARRLVDVSRADPATELLGQRLAQPLLLAPVGAQQALHRDGELATARAAAATRHAMIASTMTSYPVDEIAAAGGPLLWFQLYASRDDRLTQFLVQRAERAGARALVLTVDSATRGNRIAERWFGPPGETRLGNFEGWDGAPRIGNAALDWDAVASLRDRTRLPLVLKGIVTGEDAALAVEYGIDAVIVSNHGGRQEDSNRATLDALPEVVAAAGKMPVLLDGGVRRGADIFVALALGARAVCIGRPYLWGLGAFGEDGVARTLRLLRAELVRIMQLAGTPRIADISGTAITRGVTRG